MHSLSICLVLTLTVAFAFAAPTSEDKEAVAVRECNATIPVQQNPRIAISLSVVKGGEILNLSQEEKCFLNCLLQKLNFLDGNSNIRAAAVVNYTVTQIPEIIKYSNVLIGNIYQLNRLYKGIPDKCQKAFVYYHEVSSQIIALSFADALTLIDAQKQIYQAVENGKEVDSKLGENIKSVLDSYNDIYKQAVPV